MNVGHILKRNCCWYNNNNNNNSKNKHLNLKLKTKHTLERIKNYGKDTLKNLNITWNMNGNHICLKYVLKFVCLKNKYNIKN